MENKICCFSGHRKLSDDSNNIVRATETEIIKQIENGTTCFAAGGALGFDILCESIVLRLRDAYPQISLVLALPCPPEAQTKFWNEKQREVYFNILSKADDVKILSNRYTKNCMLQRNDYLVSISNKLICYLNSFKGGTLYTVNVAKRRGIEIVNIADVLWENFLNS